jgi:hypothetical protein
VAALIERKEKPISVPHRAHRDPHDTLQGRTKVARKLPAALSRRLPVLVVPNRLEPTFKGLG